MKIKEKGENTLAGDLSKKIRDLVGESGTYRVVKRLGLAGATSHVYQLKRQQDEKFFALKLMQPNLSREMKNHFQAEMVNLQRLRMAEDRAGTHHIPRIIESSDLDQPKTQELLRLLGNPFIIMDFADGKDINTLLTEKRSLSEEEALKIAQQFARVLLVIHGEGLTYTDMKLSNLIWKEETQHLMVIDWNVIAENRLETDAPKDRLRAAAYLFHMATGIPIELNISGAGAATQKYRRMEEFKNLSEGTQLFLKKAFHQDPLSRHGAGGTQLQCTREFLSDLTDHLDRFNLSTENLISEGETAFQDRQWEDAVLYLDLAARKLNIEEKPAQFTQLQEILEKSRNEANKLGRNAFYSGHGRYVNGLFNEALKDFKKAMQDDPYDEEARLYAILTQFALDQGEEIFLQFKQPLEECIGALLKGHFDMADNALNRLPGPTAREKAVRSLKAELIVRSAVQKGQQLLKEDKIKEALEFFRTANQEKDHILYVQPLEENLGSLTQLYRDVQDLETLYEEGKACIKQERFREAVSKFLKARKISQGSPFARKNFHFASHLNKIKTFLEEGRPENAFEQCNRTSRFDNEPVFRELKKKVSQAYAEQLRVWADHYFQAEKYIEAKDAIMELLKHKPDDEAAIVKLEEIDAKIEGGGYLEFLKQMKHDVEKDTSLATIDRTLEQLNNKGYKKFKEVQAFIREAEAKKEEITMLSEEFQDKQTLGDVEGQLDVLNKAIKIEVKLRQGEPNDLKKELLSKIQENHISKCQTHLMCCQPQRALDLANQLLFSELPEEKTRLLRQTVEKANQLLEVKQAYERLKKEKKNLPQNNETTPLGNYRWEYHHLRILNQMKQIEPALKVPLDLKETDAGIQALYQDLHDYAVSLQQQGNHCLLTPDFETAGKITAEMDEVLSILKNLPDPANTANNSNNTTTGRLRNWKREFSQVVAALENEKTDWAANYRVLVTKWLPLIENPRLKQMISILNAASQDQLETEAKEWEELENMTKDSPTAFWYYEFLNQERKNNRIWKAMAEDSSTAMALIQQTIPLQNREEYEKSLGVVKEVEEVLKNRARLDKEADSGLKEPAETLEQAIQLQQRLHEIPRLRDTKIEQRLTGHISGLRRIIAAGKKAIIKEHVGNLETILTELERRGEKHQQRINIEDKAKAEIEALEKLDQEKAIQFEKRLNHLLETFTDTIPQEARKSLKDWKYLTELQRLVCEKYQQEDKKDIDAYLREFRKIPEFEKQIPDYKKRHENVLYKLNRLSKDANIVPLAALKKLREEYGPFPEIDNAIKETKYEIAGENTRERFQQLFQEYQWARTIKEWQELGAGLEKIDASHLNEPDQAKYTKMKNDIQFHLIINEPIAWEHLLKFLENGEAEYLQKCINALERNVFRENLPYPLPQETLMNIERSERVWFSRKKVNIKSLHSWRWIKCLTRGTKPSGSTSTSATKTKHRKNRPLIDKNQEK